jgi:hypothetical protein
LQSLSDQLHIEKLVKVVKDFFVLFFFNNTGALPFCCISPHTICIENIDLLKEGLDGRANIKIEKQL